MVHEYETCDLKLVQVSDLSWHMQCFLICWQVCRTTLLAVTISQVSRWQLLSSCIPAHVGLFVSRSAA